jgi:hypothetical protein
MPNADTPFGLKPVNLRDGGNAPTITHYYVPASYATALFVGDPVVKTGTSNTAGAGQSGTLPAGSLQEINKATAGDDNPITGVIVGFDVDPSNLDKTYNPASTERVVHVIDDPDALFEIQADSANAIAATDIGSNANLVYTHSGSTVTGLSGAELNTASMTTTATFQLKIRGLVDDARNELGTNAKLIVSINRHSESNAVAGI